jgi:hypothetical protein
VKRNHKQCQESKVVSRLSLRSKLVDMRNCLNAEIPCTNSLTHDDNLVSDFSLSSPLPDEEVACSYNNLECQHIAEQPSQSPYLNPGPITTASFRREIMRGDAVKAASILVNQAAWQRQSISCGDSSEAVPPKISFISFIFPN